MMRTIFCTVVSLLFAALSHATLITPTIEFTLRDELPSGAIDGIVDDFDSTNDVSGFWGFVTNDTFVDETLMEFGVGSDIVDSAILTLRLVLIDDATRREVDVSSYDGGTGTVQSSLFGAGSYLSTLLVQGLLVENVIDVDVSGLYNSAVTAGDAFLGFRVHNVVNLDGGAPQLFFNRSSSLDLTHASVPSPSSVLLMAAGALGFALRRRRQSGG